MSPDGVLVAVCTKYDNKKMGLEIFDTRPDEAERIWESTESHWRCAALTNSAFVYSQMSPPKVLCFDVFYGEKEAGAKAAEKGAGEKKEAREEKERTELNTKGQKELIGAGGGRIVTSLALSPRFGTYLAALDIWNGEIFMFVSESFELLKTVSLKKTYLGQASLMFLSDSKLGITLPKGYVILNCFGDTAKENIVSQSVSFPSCKGSSRTVIGNRTIQLHTPTDIFVYSKHSSAKIVCVRTEGEYAVLGTDFSVGFNGDNGYVRDLSTKRKNNILYVLHRICVDDLLCFNVNRGVAVCESKKDIKIYSFWKPIRQCLFELVVIFADVLPPYLILLLFDTYTALEERCSLGVAERFMHSKKLEFVVAVQEVTKRRKGLWQTKKKRDEEL